MIETVVEAALIRHRPRYDDLHAPGEQGRHAWLGPCAVRQRPTVVVGVDDLVTATRHLVEQCALARARHARHQHPRHTATLAGGVARTRLPLIGYVRLA